MDSSEASKLIVNRISQLEPEHIARKIIGFIYFQGLSDQEMIRLALGPDTLIHNLIQKAKTARLLDSSSPTINPCLVSNPPLNLAPFPGSQLLVEQPIPNPTFKMVPFSDLEDPSNDNQFSNPSIRGCRNSPSLMDYPSKTCHYFNKGFCKNGSNCRYLHQESFPKMFGGELASGDDQLFSPGSLEKIESEITEILRSRRGQPVSIASLPMMYYEKYGRTLQADGYLTESQRQGKAGYSLTKLLARLKNSIRLIDRPHGQHAVVLAEDAPKYMDIQGERNDPGPIVNGSHQIYLTFPPESTFTEEEVSGYFSTFGPVQDVRIPCQQKRMFGFVSFESSDTVQLVLSKMNPHYVCGARVLVKPYREKPKLVERKYHPVYYHAPAHPVDINSELQTSIGWESSRLFRRQLMEEQERYTMELQAMRLSQLHLGCRPVQTMDELEIPEDHLKFQPAERLSLMLDALNSGSTSDDNPELPANTCADQESAQILNLPDSPFAPAVGSSVSAVI